MKAKYVQKKTQRKNSIWVVNPPNAWKQSIAATYMQFDTESEARDYSRELERDYEVYLRKNGLDSQNVAMANMRTVAGIAMHYKTSPSYKKLALNSRKLYTNILSEALEIRIGGSNVRFGDMLARSVTPEHADRMYAQICEVHSAHKGTTIVKILRKVWFNAFRHGKVTGNPFSKMGLPGLPPREVLWEEEEVMRFIATADEIGRSSIGTLCLLCFDLCQRPGDMLSLVRDNLNDGVFKFVQQKTKTPMTILGSPRLLKRLEDFPTDSDHFVVYEATGRPYVDRSVYNKAVRKVREAAGLPSHYQMRDMRRTGATLLGEAGCTHDELRAITGHKSADVLRIYVRTTEQLAGNAQRKRFGE